MNLDLAAIAAQHNLRKRSSGFAGPCPKCGGGSDSDKFVMKNDGGFKCYSCNFKGDAITWLRTIDGKTCAQAHEITGLECRAAMCPVRGTCRFGDGSGKPARQARSVNPVAPGKKSTVPITVSKSPAETWLAWASGLVTQAIVDIRDYPEQLAWLNSRGLGEAAVKRFSLGWLCHDRRMIRKNIGLPPKEGKEKLWVPGGLLIPIFDSRGTLHRIRIRRTPEARSRFLPKRKYQFVEGGGNDPLVIRPLNGTARGVVVVEAELDAMAVASAHPGVIVISLGTVAGGLPEWLRRECAATPVILVALDADPGKDGSGGAGPKSIASWTNTYRHARFWPVPSGKDPGEYVAEHGGNLGTWVEAGLPPAVAVSETNQQSSAVLADCAQDVAFLPGRQSERGEGDGNIEVYKEQKTAATEPTAMAAFIELLQLETGWVWRNEHELVVRYQRPQCTTMESLHRREKVTAALYGGGTVAQLLELLDPGAYRPSQLQVFFHGA